MIKKKIMKLYCPPKTLPLFYLILVLLFFSKSDLIAQQDALTEFQKRARSYRVQGWDLQKEGKIDEAVPYYQKAILLDPNYVIAYNDLGVVFEEKGWLERAKDVYLKAIEIEPNFPNSYSNLALLYEGQGDYVNAILCWMRRAILGNSSDSWAQEARKRLEYIARIRPEDFRRILQSKDFFSLFSKGAALESQKPDNKARALNYLTRAQESFSRGEYIAALKEAAVAEYLDSSNKEISAFIDKVSKTLLH